MHELNQVSDGFFFFFLKTEMFVFNQTAGLNANDASGRINTAYVNVNLPISASA